MQKIKFIIQFYKQFTVLVLILGILAINTQPAVNIQAPQPIAPKPTFLTTPDISQAVLSSRTVHVVEMISDEKGFRFEPANLPVKTGDAIKFVLVSGGPHNVVFEGTTLSPEVKKQLNANFSAKMAELTSNIMLNAGESVTVSFEGIPAGSYRYNCNPHLAMNMQGLVTVQ